MILIGIDTGTHTGVAVWDTDSRRFLSIESVTILEAVEVVKALVEANGRESVGVRFEDARKRKWIPRERDMRQIMGRAKGAGHVQRDCAIWEEFLTAWRIPFEAVAPKNNCTKLTAESFRNVTKWEQRTNEHERDAAMLVFGKTRF